MHWPTHRADGAAAAPGGNGAHRAAAGDEFDLERWQRYGLPVPLIAACTACEMGVKRAHLVRWCRACISKCLKEVMLLCCRC